MLSLCSCSKQETPEPTTPEPTTPEPQEESGEVISTDYMEVLGLSVDQSYKDTDGKPLSLVFLLFKLSTNDQNLKINSNFIRMTINGVNTYTSEHLQAAKNTTKYMPNFLYTSYITDVYIGESVNVIATFRIPEADLAPGRSITISDDRIPDAEKIRLSTDMINFCYSSKMIAQKYDKEGYKTEDDLRIASAELYCTSIGSTSVYIDAEGCLVANCEGGQCYYPREQVTDDIKTIWKCYVNNTEYVVSFWNECGYQGPKHTEWHAFSVKSSLGTENGGKFEVKKGYIICKYDSNGAVIEIPYTFDSQKFYANPEKYSDPSNPFYPLPTSVELISLDLVKAFDIYC